MAAWKSWNAYYNSVLTLDIKFNNLYLVYVYILIYAFRKEAVIIVTPYLCRGNDLFRLWQFVDFRWYRWVHKSKWRQYLFVVVHKVNIVASVFLCCFFLSGGVKILIKY